MRHEKYSIHVPRAKGGNDDERNPTAPQVDAEESASVRDVLRSDPRGREGVGERTTDAAGNDYEVHGGGGMNLPEGFENMTPVRRALEVARHELVTLHGLIVADGAAPNETFEIDTSEAVALLDKVLEQMAKRTDREVLRDCLLEVGL